jgi:DME family drug/metabolite transporter
MILGASVLWGTTGTAQALAPSSSTPLAVATLRVCFGGLALVGLARARGVLSVRRMRTAPVVAAAASLVVAQLCFFAAVERTGVAVGTAVSIGSSPIAAGALGWLYDRHRPGWRWVSATAAAVAGCALLLTAGHGVAVDATGMALALVVGTGYAGYTLATKRLVQSHPPDAATAVVFGVAALCMLPLLARASLGWVASPRGSVVALHLGLVTVALAYSLFSRGLAGVPGPTAVTLTLAEPLTAGLLGVALLGEVLSPPAVGGVVLVLAGLTLLAAETRPSR